MGSKKIKENNHTKNNRKLNKSSQKSKLIVVFIAIAVVSMGLIGFMTTPSSENIIDNSLTQNLTGNWTDVHGVGISTSDNDENSNDSLYLATHNGLFKKDLGNNSGWVEIGNDKSDLMGFAIDPSDKSIMYSSGHPQTGGNLGFRISNDYGATWQNISDVTAPTPVDFHTMTIGNNTEIIYAASSMGDNIFTSIDEGKNWSITNPPNGQQIVTLAVNQSNSKNVYAATTEGLYSSLDQGKNWQKIEDEIISGNNSMVTGIEISSDGKTAFAFVVPNQPDETIQGYIIKSIDGAKSWVKTDGQIPGVQFVSKFAFDNNDGDVYVALIQDSIRTGVASSVYSSNDGGITWTLQGTNNNLLPMQ